MNLFKNAFNQAANNQIDAWLETVTMEELDTMEKQGLNVSEWKAKVAARDKVVATEELIQDEESETDKAVRFGLEDVDRSKLSNPVNLSKLTPYIPTPRDVNSEFVKAVAGKLPLFGKDKKLQKVANGALIYAAVVQANSDLWEPGDNSFYPAVLVFAIDEKHKNNIQWLKETAGKIVALRDSEDIPAEYRVLVDFLRDQESDFCVKLGSELSGGADCWCSVYKFEEQSVLPKACLPSEGIIPFILKEGPTENLGVWFYEIPANYYV